MNRKIGWESYEFDEIGLVYEKAEENESIGRLLEQLEIQALAEAKANCGLLMTDAGGRISPEQFDNLEEEDKETVIKVLSGLGLGSVEQDLQKGIFHVWFTNKIQTVMACTMFALLNYLEKLDGAVNVRHLEWTLELQVPPGGRKGLVQWEMLIMQLYPWITVEETAAGQIERKFAADKDTSQKENGKGNSSFWERCRKMIMGIKRKK